MAVLRVNQLPFWKVSLEPCKRIIPAGPIDYLHPSRSDGEGLEAVT